MSVSDTVSPAPPMDLADLLVAYLEQMGVEYVFGVPGGAIEPLYNALERSRSRGGPRPMLARHEAGAAFMAAGYARETGKIGVCCAASGPGTTNLITAVASAFENSIPLLVITGQTALPTHGKHLLREPAGAVVNTLGMFSECTRYNTLVSHPDQFEHKLTAALQRATRAPQGPAHLSVPVDVFRHPNKLPSPAYDLAVLLQPSSMVDHQALEALFQRLDTARQVMLLVGGWCGEAIGSILQYARMTGAQVTTTPDGKGLVNPRHSLFRGVLGVGGHASAEAALRAESVDVILAIGAGMGHGQDGLLGERLIHIDESEEHLARTPMAQLHVRGNILGIFKHLVAHEEEKQLAAADVPVVPRREVSTDPETLLSAIDNYTSGATPIKPQRLMRELGRLFPPTTRFLADAGDAAVWATHYLHPGIDRRHGERRLDSSNRKAYPGRRKTEGGWLRLMTDFAPTGWAIGGAVGTAAGNNQVPVVCVTDAGSMLMNGQELSVAVTEQLTVIFVVLNKRSRPRAGGEDAFSYALSPTDFAMLARAMGAAAFTIRSPDDLLQLDMDALCAYPGPTLLDVYIDSDEIPPLGLHLPESAESGTDKGGTVSAEPEASTV